jgi:hypothetical protein
MEMLEGQTLKHLITGKPLDVEKVIDLGVQIADGQAGLVRVVLCCPVSADMCGPVV